MKPNKKKSGCQNLKEKKMRLERNVQLSNQLQKWFSSANTKEANDPPSASGPSLSTDETQNSDNSEGNVLSQEEKNNNEEDATIDETKAHVSQVTQLTQESIKVGLYEDCLLQEFQESDSSIQYDDPAKWPPITDKFICHLITCRSRQDEIEEKISFPISEDGRSFNSKWFFKMLPNGEKVRRQWLLYSESKNSLFCFPCIIFSKEKKSSFSDISKGFDNWRHLSPRLPDHENSPEHRKCYINWKDFERRLLLGKTIDDHLEKCIQSEAEKWYRILKVVVDSVLFCAKNNLALRGSSNKIGDPKCGIFLNLIEFVGHYNPIIAQHIEKIKSKKQSVTYLSWEVQNAIINLIGKQIRNEIIGQIKDAKYFSILFDCTPDVSRREQMSQIIRYVRIKNGNCTIEERFIDFINTNEKTGDGLSKEILEKIVLDGLDIMNCRGQGYDNGANMAGKYSGVQAHINRLNQFARYVPCATHTLNLIGVHASEVSPTMITFFSKVENIFTYFSGSTSRWDKLLQVLRITLKGHCATRWSSKNRAVRSLNEQIENVYKILEEISQDTNLNFDTISGAKNLIKQIDYKFVCLLDIWSNILSRIDRVNISLQNKNMSLDVASKMINGLILSIQDLRNEGVQGTFDKAKNICKNIDIDTNFPLKRKRKIKKLDPEEAEDESHLISYDETFMIECNIVYDNILNQFQRRYESLSDICSDFNFLSGKCIANMSNEVLKKNAADLVIKYFEDFDATEFCLEIESFKWQANTLFEELPTATPFQLLQMIHNYQIQNVYPNIEIALRIFLTLPVTVASCERSFSKLKLIKNYLRSSMGQERLTNLGIISIENEIAESLDYDNLIRDFAAIKARKVKF